MTANYEHAGRQTSIHGSYTVFLGYNMLHADMMSRVTVLARVNSGHIVAHGAVPKNRLDAR